MRLAQFLAAALSLLMPDPRRIYVLRSLPRDMWQELRDITRQDAATTRTAWRWLLRRADRSFNRVIARRSERLMTHYLQDRMIT